MNHANCVSTPHPRQTTKPIHVIQLNAQRKKAPILTLLNRYVSTADIILLQEPNWSKIGTDEDGSAILGPIGHKDWTPILPSPTIKPNQNIPRVLAYARRRPDLQVTLRSDLDEDDDLQILDVQQNSQLIATIINIYNDKTRRRGSPAWRLRELNLPSDKPTIITGDWNLHHIMWAKPGRIRNDTITTEIVDWLRENGYHLLNKKGETTWRSEDGKRESTIDLTWVNNKALVGEVVKEWAVDKAKSFGADHSAIVWTFDESLTEVQNTTGKQYLWNECDPADWIEAYREQLKAHGPTLDCLRQGQNTPTDTQLENAATALTKCMQAASDSAAPQRRPSPEAKPWWNHKLDRAADEVNKCRAEFIESKTSLLGLDRRLRAKVKKAENFFRRAIKFEKSKWVDEVLEKAATEDIWGFRKWAKGVRNYPSPAIKRNGKPDAVSHSDKCDALREELYQPPPPLEAEFTPNLEGPSTDELPFTEITDKEVKEAIFSGSNKSAPGPSGMGYNVLKWAWAADSEILVWLIRHCLNAGYHPKTWRRAIAIALRKPRKPDYSKPRAYRLITLLECLGKVLERVVAHRLTYLAGKETLIPTHQFGSRAGYSTTDAILTFTNDIEAAWNHNKVTSALTFDIKGYFDFVNHKKLLCELEKRRIPLQYRKWTASFLTERYAAVNLDGERGEMKAVENGIPQGSPVSPILAGFYSAELFDVVAKENSRLTVPTTTNKPTKPSLLMYVDDGMIYVSSESLDTNVKIIKKIYLKIHDTLKKAGLTVDTDKRELMHYSRRKNEPSPSISFADDDGKQRTVNAAPYVKWLGVYLDKRLLFNTHVTMMAMRGERTISGISMLANTVRGLSPTNMRLLYKGCVIPAMTYASPAWWTNKKKHEQELAKVQRRALRLICAAFRTSPTDALEIEASIPPISLTLDALTRSCALRFNKLSNSNPVIQRLTTGNWIDNDEYSEPPPLPTRPKHSRSKKNKKKTTRLQEVAKNTSANSERTDPFALSPWEKVAADYGPRLRICGPPSLKELRENAANDHIERIPSISGPSHLILYTDGSRKPLHRVQRIGAAVVGYHNHQEKLKKRIGLGSCAEVYDAEIAALSYAAGMSTKLATSHPEIKHLHFFADNAAAVNDIFSRKAKPGQFYCNFFHTRITTFLDEDPERTVEISWVPGHKNITGNERADALAKSARKKACKETWSSTRAYVLRKTKEKTKKEWTKRWNKREHFGRFAVANRLPPSLKPTPHMLSTPREVFGRIVQCRTGHGFIGEYYSNFAPSENSNCSQCTDPFQTRTHILRECPAYEKHRHILREVSRDIALAEILGTKEGITALGEFLKRSGAFTKTGRPRSHKPPPVYDGTVNDEEEMEEWRREMEEEEEIDDPRWGPEEESNSDPG